MQSSIYGGYIPSIEKIWLYSYIRFDKWYEDDGQAIKFQVSFDEGKTWQFAPTSLDKPFTSVLDWNDLDYTRKYNPTPDNDNSNVQCLFYYPYNSKFNTIAYRVWIKKGATVRPLINHISCHFNLNQKQELLFNYNISMKPRDELLDGKSVDIWKNNQKLTFLKNLWQTQDMVEITHIDGRKYKCITFSDDRTPGQGFILQTQNANAARYDKDNLEYNLLLSLKTIANYDN